MLVGGVSFTLIVPSKNMSLEILDVKDIYVIGENLKSKLGEQLGTQFSGQKLVSWLLEHDGLVRVLRKIHV